MSTKTKKPARHRTPRTPKMSKSAARAEGAAKTDRLRKAALAEINDRLDGTASEANPTKAKGEKTPKTPKAPKPAKTRTPKMSKSAARSEGAAKTDRLRKAALAQISGRLAGGKQDHEVPSEKEVANNENLGAATKGKSPTGDYGRYRR